MRGINISGWTISTRKRGAGHLSKGSLFHVIHGRTFRHAGDAIAPSGNQLGNRIVSTWWTPKGGKQSRAGRCACLGSGGWPKALLWGTDETRARQAGKWAVTSYFLLHADLFSHQPCLSFREFIFIAGRRTERWHIARRKTIRVNTNARCIAFNAKQIAGKKRR